MNDPSPLWNWRSTPPKEEKKPDEVAFTDDDRKILQDLTTAIRGLCDAVQILRCAVNDLGEKTP